MVSKDESGHPYGTEIPLAFKHQIFVDDPHTAVVGKTSLSQTQRQPRIGKQEWCYRILLQHPDTQLREPADLPCPTTSDPAWQNSKRLGAVLTLAYEKQYREFTDVLLLRGVGPRTIQSLSLVSEVIHGAPGRFDDPARFAFAHGGKDGAPFPVPLKVYDESISVLRNAVNRARIDRSDKLKAVGVLSRLTMAIEKRHEPFADVNKVIRNEWRKSSEYGGMTIKGPVDP